MSVVAFSAVKRCLEIPELLREIFNLLDKGSNAINARVSRQWSELALDILWCDVANGDFYNLLQILAPMTEMIPFVCSLFNRIGISFS